MDFHPPQGAHTSYLRTLSRINDLRGLAGLAPKNVSFKGAAHLTSNFVSVNTLKQSFFASGCPTFAGHPLRRPDSCEASPKPAKRSFASRGRQRRRCLFADHPKRAAQRRAENPTTKSRFVKPCETTSRFAVPTTLERRSPDAGRSYSEPPAEGARMVLPDRNSSSASAQFFRALPQHRRAFLTRRSGARAQTRVCQSAAGVRCLVET